MRLSIAHTTAYAWPGPMGYGLNQVRLTARARKGLAILRWQVEIAGGVQEAAFTDQHGNPVILASRNPDSDSLVVTCSGEVETEDCAGVVGPHDGRAPLWCYVRPTPRTQAGDAVTALVAGLDPQDGEAIALLHALSARVLACVPYAIGATHSATSAEEALAIGQGVCQDHTHIFVAAARSLGVPARYVSGYLLMPDRTTQEAGHAWAEAHVPGLGWVGFDVSNQICPDDRYVAVATGLDADEAAPIRGLSTPGEAGSLQVSIRIQQQ